MQHAASSKQHERCSLLEPSPHGSRFGYLVTFINVIAKAASVALLLRPLYFAHGSWELLVLIHIKTSHLATPAVHQQ